MSGLEDPRVREVTFALADPATKTPGWFKEHALGYSMIPLAEIAVKALIDAGYLKSGDST